jgi:hypothetical protein
LSPDECIIDECIIDVTDVVEENGLCVEQVVAKSLDGIVTLTIPDGTIGLTRDGQPLSEITIVRTNSPAGAGSISILGQFYELGPAGATFSDPGITLTFTYDPAELPVNTSPVIYYWNAATGSWVALVTTIVSPGIATVQVNHFTTFAIVAKSNTTPSMTTPAPTSVTTVLALTLIPTTPVVTLAPATPVLITPTQASTPKAEIINWPLLGGIGGIMIVVALLIIIMSGRKHE